jgi:hypothetical protein
MPRSIPGSDAFDALEMADNSKPLLIPVDKGNGDRWEETVVTGSTPSFPNIVAISPWTGSRGTTEHFVRIGHSLFAIVAARLGGGLSRYLYTKNSQRTSGPVPTPVSIPNDSGV